MIKNIAASIAILAATCGGMVMLDTPTATASITRGLRPCPADEVIPNCVWDARHMGNGIGRSYRTDSHSNITYISHRRAHRLMR